MRAARLDSLVTRGELDVDAEAAVLAAVGGRAGARSCRDDVLVEGNIENGAGGINVHKGMAGGAASADSSDTEDLDVRRSGSIRDKQSIALGNSGSGGSTGEEEGGETHFE